MAQRRNIEKFTFFDGVQVHDRQRDLMVINILVDKHGSSQSRRASVIDMIEPSLYTLQLELFLGLQRVWVNHISVNVARPHGQDATTNADANEPND